MTMVIFCIAPLLGVYWIFGESQRFEQNVENMRQTYRESQKQLIKQNVDGVIADVNYVQKSSLHKLKTHVSVQIEELYSLLNRAYERYKEQMTDGELKGLLNSLVLSFSSGNDSASYFVLTFAHGTKPLQHSPPSNILTVTPQVSAEMIAVAKKFGQGYYRYQKLQDTDSVDVLACLKIFEHFDWVIGIQIVVNDFVKLEQADILRRINTLSFGEDGLGLIYVYDFDGTCLANPDQDLVGLNRWDYTNPTGLYLVQKIISIATDLSTDPYLEYGGLTNPRTERPSPALAYVAAVPNWRWAVGAGVYLEDLEPHIFEMKHTLIDKVKYKALMITVALGFFMLISSRFSRRIAADFQKDFEHFTLFLRDSLINSNTIDPQSFILDEFRELASSVNRLVERKKHVEERLQHNYTMDVIGELAGGVAHGFNGALGEIKGSTSVLRSLVCDQSPEHQKMETVIDSITCSVDSANSMVNQLLTLSQKRSVDISPVDLNDVVRRALKLCERSIDDVSVVVKYIRKKAVVEADAQQLEGVIRNVCLNALHSMDSVREAGEARGGGLTIEIDEFCPDKEFLDEFDDAKEVDYYVCRVTDTGIGITKEVNNHIFDPFFNTKGWSVGTGLGLSLVSRIIQMHGGVCSVFSKIGVGTTFNIFIPQSKNIEELVQGDEDIVKGQGVVLVIDTDSSMRSQYNSILTRAGYDVILASDDCTGIAEFKQMDGGIDLVLLDIRLPGLAGTHTLEQLLAVNPNVPVLLTSDCLGDERLDRHLYPAVAGIIQKPFSVSELSRKVDDVLSSS